MSNQLPARRLSHEHHERKHPFARPSRITAVAMSLLLTILGSVVLPFDALAQEAGSPPMVTDRPDATESAVTVAVGVFQLESGYTFDKVDDVKIHSLGEILLRVGVADILELRFGINSYQWARGQTGINHGLQDSTVGLKLRLLDNEGKTGLGSPQVAVLASTSVPTGSSLMSQNKIEPEMRLSVSWDLSERLALGTNFSYSYTNEVAVDTRSHEAGTTLSLGIALTDSWGAYAEYFGPYTMVRDGPREDYVNGGVTFLVERDFQLDARIGYGLNGLEDDFFVGFGSAVRW